jgi:hypothetical protein
MLLAKLGAQVLETLWNKMKSASNADTWSHES